MKRPDSHRMLLRRCALLTIAGLMAAAPATAQEKDQKAKPADKVQKRVFSGPQPGEKIKSFKVLHMKSGEAVELEVARKPEKRVTLICFIHKLSTDDRILYGLGLVDFYARRHKDLRSHFVLLSDDKEKMTKMLQGWARGSLFRKSIVSVAVDGAQGPGFYGLNRQVAMTVVVARGEKVVSNLVFQAPNNRDLQKIMAAVAKAHGKPSPTLAKVQQELRTERQKELDKRIKASPVFKLAPNEQLGRIMFGMVNARGNRALVAKRRNQQLLDWAGDDKERKAALKKYCKAVLDGEFTLNRYSREALEKLAEE